MLIEQFLEKNESSTSIINIRNGNDKNLELSIYLKDKAFIDGTEAEVLPATSENSCAEWIFYTPSVLNIPPGESASVRINISVPDSAVGTCWSHIFIEETSPPKPNNYKIKGNTINFSVNMRVGVLLTQTVPGSGTRNGLIEKIDLVYNEDFTKGFIEFDFFNNGNLISECNGWVEFRDIDGLSIEKIQLGEIPKIYPLERRNFKIEVPNNLITGEYSALAVIDYGGTQLVAGEVIFKYEGSDE